MAREDFRRFLETFRRAGFDVEGCSYDKQSFGSWWIVLLREGLPRQRVVWDGKDAWLIMEVFGSSGTWLDKWIGRQKSEQTPEAALAQLEVPVTREWEQQTELQRAERGRTFLLELALSYASSMWDAGRYPDYVSALSPYRDQLSPSQLEQLDIAMKRAGAG